MDAAKQILKYVNSTLDIGLLYKKDTDFLLHGFSFSDADFDDGQLLVIFSYVDLLVFHAAARNKTLSPCQLLKQNTMLPLLLLRSVFGYVFSSGTSIVLLCSLLIFLEITKVLSK